MPDILNSALNKIKSSVHRAFNQFAAPPAMERLPEAEHFKYGWCHTDHKDGLDLRKDYRSKDYMNEQPYAACVAAMLKELGLPQPDNAQIFRGTYHDMLFLDSHGVVIRIGPTDVQDLMNPGILQPLGWLEDKKHMIKHGSGEVPLTVAIYPGIELYKNFMMQENRPEQAVENLSDFLKWTHQNPYDVTENNQGIIRILDENGQREIAVPILLDPDNRFNGSLDDTTERRSKALKDAQKNTSNKHEIISMALRAVFNAASQKPADYSDTIEPPNINHWHRAMEVHAPLRELFWEAFDTEQSKTARADPAALNRFWEKCRTATNKPTSMSVPCWSVTTDENGQPAFSRHEETVETILYRPWTENEEDKHIQPLVSNDLRTAVARAHEKIFPPTNTPYDHDTFTAAKQRLLGINATN